MSDMFFLPKSFPCSNCKKQLSVRIILNEKVICPWCNTEQDKKDYGKYFGMIKDVKD